MAGCATAAGNRDNLGCSWAFFTGQATINRSWGWGVQSHMDGWGGHLCQRILYWQSRPIGNWDKIHVGLSILGKASARQTMLAWFVGHLGFLFWAVSLLFASDFLVSHSVATGGEGCDMRKMKMLSHLNFWWLLTTFPPPQATTLPVPTTWPWIGISMTGPRNSRIPLSRHVWLELQLIFDWGDTTVSPWQNCFKH